MKRILLVSLCWLGIPCALFAQGSLTPPGAPAPTMKTLDQIEARTPIPGGTSTVTISNPGSYYLIGNITVSTGDGIDITSSNVSLDLNGFTISSTASSPTGSGILFVGTLRNISLSNGSIHGSVTVNNGSYSGGGFSNGIYYSNSLVNVRVSRIFVSNCGNFGIAGANLVDACCVDTVGLYGILTGVAQQSYANNCGYTGISATAVSHCAGYSTGAGSGVDGTTVENSYGFSQFGIGLSGKNVTNCYGYCASSDYGVYAQNAHNSYGSSNTGDGIYATVAQTCWGESGSSNGIQAESVENSEGKSDGAGNGIYAHTILNSTGYTATGTGVRADETATGCYGAASGNGTGVNAFIANVCRGVSNTSTTTVSSVSSSHNVNSY